MKNEFLRHTIATISYRFRKSVSEADAGFGSFQSGKGSRSPTEIINHMYRVLNMTKVFIETETFGKTNPESLSLQLEIDRFNAEIKEIDETLNNRELGIGYAKRLLQGPFSDIFTHIGQISMLSRMYGKPIPGEDFSAAKVEVGKFE